MKNEYLVLMFADLQRCIAEYAPLRSESDRLMVEIRRARTRLVLLRNVLKSEGVAELPEIPPQNWRREADPR